MLCVLVSSFVRLSPEVGESLVTPGELTSLGTKWEHMRIHMQTQKLRVTHPRASF